MRGKKRGGAGRGVVVDVSDSMATMAAGSGRTEQRDHVGDSEQGVWPEAVGESDQYVDHRHIRTKSLQQSNVRNSKGKDRQMKFIYNHARGSSNRV